MKIFKSKEKENNNKKSDPLKKITFVGFICISLIIIITALFSINVFNLRNLAVKFFIDNMLSNQLVEKTAKIEEKYNKRYLEDFNEKNQSIKQKQQELATKEEKLKKKEEELLDKEKRIEALQKDLEKKKEEIYGVSKDVSELSDVYSTMTPEQAAKILSDMSNQNLVKDIIFNMKEEVSGALLEKLDSELAASITEKRYINGVRKDK